MKNLKTRLGNVINSYNKISDPIEPMVKKAEELYNIKKDLKRVIF